MLGEAHRHQCGLCNLVSVPVQHCPDAHGVVLSLWCGEKIVYSGDTRPCERLVREGWGATLLIHEATFDDTMLKDAIKKRHSTSGEAINVAIRMSAKQLVLTHFSQRYPKIGGELMKTNKEKKEKKENQARQEQLTQGSKGTEGDGLCALSNNEAANEAVMLSSATMPPLLLPSQPLLAWCVAFDGMTVTLASSAATVPAYRNRGGVASASEMLPTIRDFFDGLELEREKEKELEWQLLMRGGVARRTTMGEKEYEKEMKEMKEMKEKKDEEEVDIVATATTGTSKHQRFDDDDDDDDEEEEEED